MTDATFTQEDLDAAVAAATTGLINKNNELIGERRADSEKLTAAEQAVEDARAKAVSSEEERLKLAGDVDGLKAHYESQLAETTAAANQAKELAESRLNKIHSDKVINEVLDKVDDRFKSFVKTQLASNTNISYNEQGEVVISITDNKQNYSSVSDFLDGVKEVDAWQSVLKGVDSSGAGTTNNRGSATFDSNKSFDDMGAKEKAAYMESKYGK